MKKVMATKIESDTLKKKSSQKGKNKGNQNNKRYTKDIISELIEEMLKFYKNEKHYHLLEFTNEMFIKFRNRGISFSRPYFYELLKANPELKKTYDYTKDICCMRILNSGFADSKKTALSIFLLKNLAPDDFKDKHETELTGGGLNIIWKPK